MIVKVLIPGIVIILMFIVGMGLQPRQFSEMARQPIPLLGGTIMQMLLLPAGALGIVFLLDPPVELAAGLILISACPGGALSNFYSHLGRLNVALSIMMTTISSLISFIALPVILALIMPLVVSVNEPAIPIMQLIQRLFLMLILPVGIGMLVRHHAPKLVVKHVQSLRVIGLILVVLLLALIVSDQWSGAKRLVLDSLIISVLFTSFAIVSGWLVAFGIRRTAVDRYVFSIEFSVRNVGVAAIVASTTLGRPEFVIFGALFVVFQFPLIMLMLITRRITSRTEGSW